MSKPLNVDQPIPFTVTDPDAPVPYRIRVATPSPELRAFVAPSSRVPTFDAPPPPVAQESGPRLKVT
jgi:hypothetical protein